jgi:hypothetical protein
MLRSQISLSEQVNDMSIYAALLFTWMIAHADDFGRMPGGARKVKALVVPMRDDFTSASVEDCLVEMDAIGVVQRYEVKGEMFIQFPAWEEHQQGLHKRTRSKFPPPEDAIVPGDSGKLQESPASCARAEQNRTGTVQEQEQREAPASVPLEPMPTAATSAKEPAARGTVLPADWVLPKAWGEAALELRPEWSPARVRQVAEMFRDHWRANANQASGKKLDWLAAWRNWVRKEAGPARSGARPSPHALPLPGVGAYGKTTPMTAEEAAEQERLNAIDPVF